MTPVVRKRYKVQQGYSSSGDEAKSSSAVSREFAAPTTADSDVPLLVNPCSCYSNKPLLDELHNKGTRIRPRSPLSQHLASVSC